MNLITKMSTTIFSIILILFCIPFVLPSYELSFILIQFSLLLPIFLFLSFFKTDLYGIALISIYFSLLVLIIFGLPGSIIGWMSMVCSGYLFGAKAHQEQFNILYGMKFFILLSVAFSLWIVIKNYQNIFSYELLSDYFESSSINTVPLLIICLTNLVCAFYYYIYFFIPDANLTSTHLIQKLLYLLLATSLLLVIVFEFRSGLGAFILFVLVAWNSLGNKFPIIKIPLIFIILGAVIYLWKTYFDLITGLIVPGRADVFLVLEELASGSLRYERVIKFWEVAAFSKTNFPSWSSNFSVSGMSDLSAALFPISIIFFIPSLYLFKLFKYIFTKRRFPALIILCAAFSSFLISFLQPDFFSMFTFFSISSLVYFGERKKRIFKN